MADKNISFTITFNLKVDLCTNKGHELELTSERTALIREEFIRSLFHTDDMLILEDDFDCPRNEDSLCIIRERDIE